MATDQVITDETVVEEVVEPVQEVPVVPVPEAPAAIEAPEVTVPFNIPESLRTAEVETVGGMSPTDIEAMQSRNTELERQYAENLQIRERNDQDVSIQSKAQTYLNTYQLDSLTPEQVARLIATEVTGAEQKGRTELESEQLKGRIEVGRRAAATKIGKDNNVDPNALMHLNSPAEMEERAKWIVELNKTNKNVAELQQARHPDQKFAGTGTDEVVNSENIDKLYMDWETSHPDGGDNPYEERYGTFLNQNRS